MTARIRQKRRIGRTDLEVTTLGLGCATLAGSFSPVSPEQARATVSHALDNGISYLDAAPHYGFGRSEHFVGDALRPRRDEALISTKVGRLMKPVRGTSSHGTEFVDPFPFRGVFDYSYDGIMRSFEDSLQRLGMSSVDILYVHDLGAGTHGVEGNQPYWEQFTTGGGHRALRELRDGGSVNAIGLGVNEWQVLMEVFALGDWDVFLLAGRYTLLEQTALDPFLSTCLARGASVVIGGPFNSGILVGGATFNYAKAPDHIVARVKAIETVCQSFDVPLPFSSHSPPRCLQCAAGSTVPCRA